MHTNKTHYAELPQFIPSDKPKMADYNEAFSRTDAALAAAATALAAKADKSTETAATLPATGWDGMGPYTQTVNIPGIVAGVHGQFDVANDATDEQRTQYLDAQLFDVTPEGQDAVTFLAMGDLPAGDIPLKILIVG